LDQQRVDALLNVNNLILQEVQILQKAGLKPQPSSGNPQSPQQDSHANASSPQSKSEGATASPKSNDPSAAAGANPSTASSTTTPTTTTPTTGTPQQPSLNTKKFVEYMRRLQSNIMFLVNLNKSPEQAQRLPYPTYLETLPKWLAEDIKEEDRPQFEALKEGYGKLRELWPDWKPTQAPTQQQSQAQPQAQGQQQTGVQQSQLQPQNRSQ